MRLAGNTIVQTLDIDTGEPWRGPITSLFEKYPTCLELPFINPYHNVLKLNNVKITDWTGWTNLLYIEQNIMYGEVWKEVKIGRESVIALFHPKSLIPTWRNMNYRRSFNGREVYEYKVVPITELDEARGRVLYGSDPSSDESFFLDIQLGDTGYDHPVFYTIHTESRFYNVNNILDTNYEGTGSR